MPKDIVIDTNVFMHADNPSSGRQETSIALLNYIDTNRIPIGIDEARVIFGEYLEYLSASSLGRNLLAKWIARNTFSLITTKLSASDNRWVSRRIRDTLDKIFLKVAINSEEKDLVSHDFVDFPTPKRKEVRGRYNVLIQTADEYL